jgi:hypothetical protein
MNAKLKWEGRLFTLCIGAVLAGALWIARPWPVRASIGIVVLGSLGVLLAAWQFVLDMRRQDGAPERSQLETPAAVAENKWGNVEIWSWIIGFFLLIQLVGFPIAVPLFVLAYSKFYGARWPLAIGVSAIAWSFVYGVFEKILHVPWPTPLIQTFFGY